MERKDGKAKVYTKSEKTRRKIMKVLLELLDTHSIDDVTIQDICDKADIHRTTFYKHYGCIFDVMDAISAEITNAFSNVLTVLGSKEEYFDFLADFIIDYRRQIKNFNKTKYKDMVISPLAVVLYEFYRKLFRIEKKPIPEGIRKDLMFRYHVSGTLAIAEYWLEEKCTRDECRAGIAALYNMIFNEK